MIGTIITTIAIVGTALWAITSIRRAEQLEVELRNRERADRQLVEDIVELASQSGDLGADFAGDVVNLLVVAGKLPVPDAVCICGNLIDVTMWPGQYDGDCRSFGCDPLCPRCSFQGADAE